MQNIDSAYPFTNRGAEKSTPPIQRINKANLFFSCPWVWNLGTATWKIMVQTELICEQALLEQTKARVGAQGRAYRFHLLKFSVFGRCAPTVARQTNKSCSSRRSLCWFTFIVDLCLYCCHVVDCPFSHALPVACHS